MHNLRSVMDYILRRIAAWWRGVPFEIYKLWIPGYTTFGNGEHYDGCFEVRGFSGKGAVGDVFGLLRTEEEVHLYEITKRYRSSGSDHIVTPYKHDWRYVDTMTHEEYEEAQEERRQEMTPHLLSVW